ncbi:50S ribosomal protein L19 [Thalictrum thalictroides]|uniref:50S ribosomal protein L19 n=1 Tax=Thalictrum thalictroides TaxID=46969 RepID=A0A7J6WWD5_THATH|nr:50S ribosomal protein L19 [Thalictrum thalictroides]
MQAVLRNLRAVEGFRNRISFSSLTSQTKIAHKIDSVASNNYGASSLSLICKTPGSELFKLGMCRPSLFTRCITTNGQSSESISKDTSASIPDIAPRIKFKRLDKTARHIMQILDKEAVQEVKERREVAQQITDIKPGYIVQLKVEVPENKRRVSNMKGIVIARRNAGLNSTFRIRRLVAGVGVESVFPLYSPNIKEIKILEKKRVRRAKLYYLRDKMNALKKQTSR